MRPEALLDKFAVIAEAPNGVRRIREIILHLAVRGKLVPQEPTSERAEAELPAGWHLGQLGGLAEFIMGQAPPGSDCNVTGEGTVFVKAGEFGDPRPIVREWTTKPLKFAKRGDVLICVVGATAGKLNLAIDCAIGRSVAAIRPCSDLSDLYLYLALQVQVTSLRRGARGSAQGVITRADLARIEIPLPSLREQHEIVAKVDELMALCDDFEECQRQRSELKGQLSRAAAHRLTTAIDNTEFVRHWRRLLENFHSLYDTRDAVAELRNAVLQLAVDGRLVPQDPGDRPVVSGASVEQENLPVNWSVMPLGDVVEIVRGISFPGAAKFSSDGPGRVACLRTSNVQAEIEWDNMIFAPAEYVKNEAQWVRRGDVIISMANSLELVGKVALVRDAPPKMTFGGFLAAIRASRAVDPEFLFLLLRSPKILSAIRGTASRTTNIANISLGGLRPIEIALPPLPEQRRIVSAAGALLMLCDDLQHQLEIASEKAAHVAASVAHHVSAA